MTCNNNDTSVYREYDANGNLTKDLNRNILSIQYNSLNLPSEIFFADGKAIRYTYSADGRKLRAVYTTPLPATTKQIDYCGNLVFENAQQSKKPYCLFFLYLKKLGNEISNQFVFF